MFGEKIHGGFRMSVRVLLLAALVLAGFLLVGCDSGTAEDGVSPEADGLTLVATTGMVEDVVRAVAGDQAQVLGMMGPGVDPHLYQPTRTDVGQMIRADAIFLNGLLLEGQLTDSIDRAREQGKPVFALAEALDGSSLLSSEEADEEFDPHVWMDPQVWARVVDIVRDAMIEIDPEGAESYRSNAAAYRAQVEALDAYASRVLSSVPQDQRVLVSAHDAFGYFGRRFGFEVVGIQGLSTQSEAGVRDIERLVSLLVERQIGAVFVESTVSDRNVRSLIDGAAARGHTVVIGGELFSDAMGDSGTYEGTYIGMIDHNVTRIARALGGDAPESGFQGKLGTE
jgi:manganese/zinc/iron transport system substrate-binding protein